MPDPIDQLKSLLEGRYGVERELGEGGMATVYLARDLRHDRQVALKVLRPELAAVVGAERFLAEIGTTARLQHPNILPLFDSGEAGSFLYYVMPYVDGESLRERLDRERQLPVDEAVRIATEVAEALQAAHEQGIVHRDIKPANILLSRGRPLVADFGIALAVSQAGGDRLTETGLSVGTPYYMSPEQATGDPSVGPTSDVYALGCVLYEMLVGEPPHTGATAQAVLGKILLGSPARPTEHRPTIPAAVEGAILRALEKLPADRFPGAAEFARALRDPDFRYGPSGEAESPTAQRGRGLLTGALSATTLLFLALALWGWLRPGPSRVVRFHLAMPEGVTPVTRNGVNIDLSPDGSRIVFVASGPGGGVQLWQRSLDRLEPSPIPGTDEARNPRFSPDGTAVAFSSQGRLRSLSLEGTPPVTLVDDSVPDGGGGLAWSEDGNLYFRKQGRGIWRIPAAGGEAEEVTTLGPSEAGHVWLDALPGARGLLYTRDAGGGPAEDEIAVLDLRTGESRVLLGGAMARYATSGHIVFASGEGTLLAAPFDADRLEVTGPAEALLEGVEVLTGSASYFALSGTGVLFYRPGAGQSDWTPAWVDPDGSETLVDPDVRGDLSSPAISPDERRVAFSYGAPGGTRDIWIYDLEQGAFDRLTFEGWNRDPFWSPDGREVGFTSERDGAPAALYARPWDLSAESRRLLEDPDGEPLGQALWTPDSGGIVYRRGEGPDTDLYYRPSHPDSAPVAVLDDDFRVRFPALSPNGRWLAYTSDASGREEVYVRPFPGPGGRSIVSSGGGITPVWARDGEIVYEGAQGFWVSATLRTEPDFAVEARRPLVSTTSYVGSEVGRRSFDVARTDGRLLLIRRTGQGARVPDVVVLDWFEELEARVGG